MANDVDNFLAGLDHPLKETISALREVILGADEGIAEHIKWNAPSFCHGGEDRVTMNLRAKDHVKLIFHRGSKKRADEESFSFTDPSGFMVWASGDRAVVELRDLQDVKEKERALAELVRAWMSATV